MRYKIRNRILPLAVCALTILALLSSSARAAGTATLSLSPASGTYGVGSVISVGIYEDSGTDSVNSVQANLSYDSNHLSCSSSNITSSAAYNLSLQNTCGSGSVQIARAANPAVTGSQLVATVSFTTTAAGSAAISFASGSGVARSTDHGAETLTTIGASYTISAPSPPGGGGSGGSTGSSGSSGSTSSGSSASSSKSSSSSSTKSSPSTTSNPAPAAFTISSIAVTNLSDKTATITWKTSLPTTSEVDYGTTTHYLATATDQNLTTNHYVVLDPSNLLANTTFHFLVKGVDASHNVIASPDQSFKTLVAVPAARKSWSITSWLAAAGAFILLLIALAALIRNLARNRHHHSGLGASGPFNNTNGSGTIITPVSGSGTTIISPITGDTEEPESVGSTTDSTDSGLSI